MFYDDFWDDDDDDDDDDDNDNELDDETIIKNWKKMMNNEWDFDDDK